MFHLFSLSLKFILSLGSFLCVAILQRQLGQGSDDFVSSTRRQALSVFTTYLSPLSFDFYLYKYSLCSLLIFFLFSKVNFWKDESNRRDFFVSFAKERSFDMLIPENWYTIKQQEVVARKGIYPFLFLNFSSPSLHISIPHLLFYVSVYKY